MTGLFVWVNPSGMPNAEWTRYSLSYAHNQGARAMVCARCVFNIALLLDIVAFLPRFSVQDGKATRATCLTSASTRPTSSKRRLILASCRWGITRRTSFTTSNLLPPCRAGPALCPCMQFLTSVCGHRVITSDYPDHLLVLTYQLSSAAPDGVGRHAGTTRRLTGAPAAFSPVTQAPAAPRASACASHSTDGRNAVGGDSTSRVEVRTKNDCCISLGIQQITESDQSFDGVLETGRTRGRLVLCASTWHRGRRTEEKSKQNTFSHLTFYLRAKCFCVPSLRTHCGGRFPSPP